ncbi:MAG: hypothetical protein VX346_26885 [Planctomycetota bacterium]|nr:hypothetical protein [Planctomycetota bacterium]
MLMDRRIYLARWVQYAAFAGLFLLGILAPRMWRGREVSSGTIIESSSMGYRRIPKADPLRPQEQVVQHAVPSSVQPTHQHEGTVAATVMLERGSESPSVLPSLYLVELGSTTATRRPQELSVDHGKLEFEIFPAVTNDALVHPRELRTKRIVPLATVARPLEYVAVDKPVSNRVHRSQKLQDLRRTTNPVVLRAIEPEITSDATKAPALARARSRRSNRWKDSWPDPAALLHQLRCIQDPPLAADWAEQIVAQIRAVAVKLPDPDESIWQGLDQLSALVVRGASLAETLDDAATRRALLSVGYAVVRRIAIWRAYREILEQEYHVATIRSGERENVARWISQVDEHLASVEHPEQWRAYLLLDIADKLTRSGSHATLEQQRSLAESMLRRLASPKLSQRQREFFSTTPFSQLTRSLQQWVAEPVDYAQLLGDLESYESRDRRLVARRVAQQYNLLRWSPSAPLRRFGEQVNLHYRNANLRVTVSESFLNRMLPALKSVEMPIDECVMGARVEGSSLARTNLAIRLIKAPWSWRLRLEAQGEVESQTKTTTWPAQLVNRGHATFRAQKMLLMDSVGTFPDASRAAAISESELTDLQTSFDVIPVVRSLVRGMVLREYEKAQPLAEQTMESRVSRTVEAQLDREVAETLDISKQKISDRVLDPLDRLGLEPRIVHLQTTEHQLVGRYRLASDRQLGSYTPRPREPKESEFSVQFHESAVNNALEQIQFDGREMELRQWLVYLLDIFGQKEDVLPQDIPENVKVRFAADEAVRVNLEEGRVELSLRFAEVSDRRNRWRNFGVTVWYRPQVEGLSLKLVRDGYISVAGRRRKLALRAIFAKVFSKARPLTLLNLQEMQESGLQGLHFTQCVVRDGWFGAAVGPEKRVAATRRLTDSQ